MTRKEIWSELFFGLITETAIFFVRVLFPLAVLAGLLFVAYHFIAKGW